MKISFGVTPLVKKIIFNKGDGISNYINSYVDLFKKNNLNVSYYYYQSSDLIKNITNNYNLIPINYTFFHLLNFLQINTLKEEYFGSGIDIVHAADHRIPRLKKKPVVATVHDIIPIDKPHWEKNLIRKYSAKYIFLKSISFANKVIAPSKFTAQKLIESKILNPNNVEVIPNSFDKSFYERLSNSEIENILNKFQINKNFFLFVGTISPRKNLYRILLAIDSMPKDFSDNFLLVISGRFAWGDLKLKKKIKEMVKNNKIKFLNYVDHLELKALYQKAHCLIHPSLYEGFGINILEAFASKTLVITSNTTSLIEFGLENAIYIDPYNLDELKDAINYSIKNTSKTNKIIKKAYDKSFEYSWDLSFSKTLSIYHKLLKDGK